jgi:hypothetical protein
MAVDLYCWRCRVVLPMLDEAEWAELEPLLVQRLTDVQSHRELYGAMLAETPVQDFRKAALNRYRELTGFDETNVNALWHHRVSLYGPPCGACGKPLRTERASFCAACGHPAPARDPA